MLTPESSEILQLHYKNTDAWRVRNQTHEMYTRPQINFVEWVMKHIALKGDERILDVGCGPGRYYDFLQQKHPGVDYVGLDYSAGMMDEHGSDDRLVRAPMDTLPFPDGAFDIVMANHVVYLAPDVELMLLEARRVLKPGGLFICATNSITTMPQFRELFRRAILLVSPPGMSREVKVPAGLHQRFALENGARMLARHYYAVVRYDLPSALEFSEVEPIMDYLESTRATREPQLPGNVSWDQVMLIMREQLANLIATLDKLVVDKLSGVLVATNGGGFIHEYLTIKEQAEKADPS
ncbi:MAG: class I SAM-dependent methyltransferase [Chloroflexota bacterium]